MADEGDGGPAAEGRQEDIPLSALEEYRVESRLQQLVQLEFPELLREVRASAWTVPVTSRDLRQAAPAHSVVSDVPTLPASFRAAVPQANAATLKELTEFQQKVQRRVRDQLNHHMVMLAVIHELGMERPEEEKRKLSGQLEEAIGRSLRHTLAWAAETHGHSKY